MIKIDIPGKGTIAIENLVLDYNGTIAMDGKVKEGVQERLRVLEEQGIRIFVLTADTYGDAKEQCKSLPVVIQTFDREHAAQSKKEIVKNLGSKVTMTIGNGNNDAQMFEESILSVALIGDEGCASKAILASDILCNQILDAIDLLLHPTRIKATLRT